MRVAEQLSNRSILPVIFSGMQKRRLFPNAAVGVLRTPSLPAISSEAI